jgi:MOSC domain-containing protein YiiM
MATIYSIVYQPIDKKYESGHGDSFIREPLEQAALIANHGLEGDAKAGRQSSRQLNIISWEWLEGLKQYGYRTQPGEFGEQIIIKDLDIDTLQQGTRLQIGSAAVVEITKPREGCVRLEAAQGRSNDAYGGLVGKMAKVITSGAIQVGDPVVIA